MIAVTVDLAVHEPVPAGVETILEPALRDARDAYREGRPGWGEYLIARAALSVARVTECQASVEQLGDLVYLEAGKAPQPVAGGAA